MALTSHLPFAPPLYGQGPTDMSMNLEKLREEIARKFAFAVTGAEFTWQRFTDEADDILAIPSIATALRFTDLHRQAGNVVGDPKIKPQAKGS